MTLALRYAIRSDVGLLREGNEDAAYAGPRLLAVADGMGGHAAGEVASAAAISALSRLDEGVPGTDLLDALADAVIDANHTLHNMVVADPSFEGMGTTLTAMLWSDGRMALCHIGDSRAYRLRDNRFEQMTLDHSLLQELVDRGFYSQQEAQRATNKNYVTRALGVEQNVEVEIHEQPAQKSDYYVLCSDGLSDMIEDEDIHLTISTFSANLDTVAKQLIQLSNDNGGRDNVSVIMAHVQEPFPAHRRIFDKILGWFG